MSALTEWNPFAANTRAAQRRAAPLAYFLGFVFVLFIGILIFCYVVTKRTNPVFLDQQGKPVVENSQSPHH